ncbi:MAG TPA: hypothetical protein VKT82_02415 [Ktedonobacterales bacterium]|nr:hypothetical protein [Ktedonobacterales bacterium]
MSSSMHRQGDILLTAIDRLPEGLTLRSGNVIVMGEATGHAHRLQEGRVLEDVQGNLFLEVLIPTQVVHQEHHSIELKPGCYQVTRQREYAPGTPGSVRSIEEEMEWEEETRRREEEMRRREYEMKWAGTRLVRD